MILGVFPVFCLLLLTPASSSFFINPYGKFPAAAKISGGDPGEPLILTPFIQRGELEKARNLSRVQFSGFKNVISHSGYLTVNERYNSNLFFWYFPAKTGAASAPVVLWLQGGPGASSLIGLFAENGPFTVKRKHGLKLRKYSWALDHNLIYVDNPVGTGFSFTDEGGYAQNETVIGEELHAALAQFFTLFAELQKNEFYVAGESYAGKYVPAVCHAIHRHNGEGAKPSINLHGLSIGNGLSDPINQLKYGDYLYQIGLVDSNLRQKIKALEEQGTSYIKNKQWVEAFKFFDDLLNGDLNNHTSLFKNITGFSNYFNYLYATEPDADLMEYVGKYLQRADIRQALHVGNKSFDAVATQVEINLMSDVMQSVAPWITELLANYRVLIYNGQLDIIVAYPLTVNYLQNLNFDAAAEYKTAPRHQWYVDGELAGYVKTAGNLTEIMVRDAGHMVPRDQPKWGFDLITRFTRNKPFYKRFFN